MQPDSDSTDGVVIGGISKILAEKNIECEFPCCENTAQAPVAIGRFMPFLCAWHVESVPASATLKEVIITQMQKIERATNIPPRWR